MGFFSKTFKSIKKLGKSLIGPALGAGAGYLAAPFTGGLSIPLSMGIGAGLGGATQTALGGGDTGDILTSGALSGLGGYGVGSLMPNPVGATTLSSSAPSAVGAGAAGAATASGTGATGLGTSGISLTSPYTAGASYSLPGAAGTAAKIGGMAAPTAAGAGGATGAGGILAGLKKWGPLAIGADYLAKGAGIGAQQDASEEALSQYLGAHKESTEWTDSDRQKMMKAVMGIYSEDVEAAKRKASSSMADRGVGGGAYGQRVDKIKRQGREAAARSLSGTHGPSGKPPSASAFFANAAAQGRSAGAETAQDALNFGGQLSTLALINQLFR